MMPLILSSFLLYLSLSRDSKEKGLTSVFRGRATSPLLLMLPVERLAFGWFVVDFDDEHVDVEDEGFCGVKKKVFY